MNEINTIPNDDRTIDLIEETEEMEIEVEPLDPDELALAGTPKERFNRYRSSLRIMDQIHNDIADIVNEKRHADFIAFFRPEDRYIPESKNNNHYELMMQARAMPDEV